jgi:recombinational DNA repair protein RecR
MENKIKRLIEEIEPLLEVQLKQANRFGSNTVSMSTARAIDIIRRTKEIRKEIRSKEIDNTSMFRALDKKFARFI